MTEPFPDFDKPDFFSRWRRARLQSLRGLLKIPTEADTDEFKTVSSLAENQREEALKGVFLASRKLAKSLTASKGMVFELSDLQSLFEHADFPCLKGSFAAGNETIFLRRSSCQKNASQNSFFCAYSKEAIDGLVMGLTDDISFARHACATSGDEICTDVFFDEKRRDCRFGSLDDAVFDALPPIHSKLKRLGIDLRVEGQSERVLYYCLTGIERPLCGPSAQMFHQLFHDEIKKRFPYLKTRDASPLAVFADTQNT